MPPQRKFVRIALIGSDRLQLEGLRTFLRSAPELELSSILLSEIGNRQEMDLALLRSNGSANLFDIMATIKACRPDLRIVVMGLGMDEESILKVVAAGAKGYVDAAADAREFEQALRAVSDGSVWAPRKVLSLFIERVSNSPGGFFPPGGKALSNREKEVLQMLVESRSNKEIGNYLGITERTVKAHVASLMRKVGVQNRIELSVHAITNSLVFVK